MKKKELSPETSPDPFAQIRRDVLRIFFLGILAILVALVVMSTLSLTITQSAVLERLLSSDLPNTATSLSASIESRIERSVETSLLLAQDPSIHAWVASEEMDEEAASFAQNRLMALVEDFGYDTAFLTSNLTHRYWSATPEDGFRLLATLSPDRDGDQWFYSTLKMEKRYSINIDHNVDLDETFLWINVLVGELDEPMAITGVGLNLTEVIDDLIETERKQGLPADIWLIDSKGQIALSKNEATMNQPLKNLLPHTLATDIVSTPYGRTYEAVTYKGDDGHYDLVHKPLANSGWHLVVRIARSQSLGFLDRIRLNTLVSAFVIVLTTTGLFALMTRRVTDPYRQTLALNKELENRVAERTAELVEKNEKINASIETARVIQQAILPAEQRLRSSFLDHAIHWKPRDQVGGDFYWAREIHQHLLIVVGDCTGHGVPGALMTMAAHAALDHIVDSTQTTDPARLLRALSDEIGRTVGEGFGNSRVQPGLDGICLCIAPDGTLSFAGARLDLFIRRGRTIERLRGDRVTLDGTTAGDDLPLETKPVDGGPIEALFLITDGFFDQPGGPKGLPYGRKRFMRAMETFDHTDLEKQLYALLADFNQYAENQTQRDDLTLLFLLPKGVKPDRERSL